MWDLFKRRTQVWMLVAITLVLVVTMRQVLELILGEAVSLFRVAAAAVFIIVVLLTAAANHWWRALWHRWPIFARLIFPDLNGTWKGTLKTTWKDEGGHSPGPIEITVWIRQNFFTTSIRLRTGESNSWSTRLIAEPYPDEGRYRVWYSYENRPRAELEQKSKPHEGVAWLEISPLIDRKKMIGQYYTDRRTTGDIEIVQVDATYVGRA